MHYFVSMYRLWSMCVCVARVSLPSIGSTSALFLHVTCACMVCYKHTLICVSGSQTRAFSLTHLTQEKSGRVKQGL